MAVAKYFFNACTPCRRGNKQSKMGCINVQRLPFSPVSLKKPIHFALNDSFGGRRINFKHPAPKGLYFSLLGFLFVGKIHNIKFYILGHSLGIIKYYTHYSV